jgi:hydroxyethylthiazole kinase-like uncharacterized protein yjeF
MRRFHVGNSMSLDRLYTAQEIRLMDRALIVDYGIPGLTLMARAADAAVATILEAFPEASRFCVLCGSGNNAGDGYLVAAKLASKAHDVTLVQVGDVDKLGSDALSARAHCLSVGLEPRAWDEVLQDGALEVDLFVDALLGLGTSGPPRTPFDRVIRWLNAMPAPVLALDVPSGLHPDFGRPEGECVQASHTMTFIADKIGLRSESGPDYAGVVSVSDLGMPADAVAQFQAMGIRRLVAQALPPRSRAAHKGDFGHVLVIGGDVGMAGAALLAGEAALRAGAGLVTLATHPHHASALSVYRPELMVRGVSDAAMLAPLIERADVVAIGPGLGQSAWSIDLFQRTIGIEQPMVIDADALNLFARAPRPMRSAILTPHPKEAARLLDHGVVDPDRLAVLDALQARYQCVIVLKGAATLVHDGETAMVNTLGSPGMASAGMGDALTGCIAGLVVQMDTLADAAGQGVAHHGRAGAWAAAELGEAGMLASDVIHRLGRSLRGEGDAKRS